MTNPVEDEEPLDPQVEAIRKRLVRLLMVSGGIMAVGLLTVIIAIVYRLQAPGAPASGSETGGEPVAIILPKGAELISSDANADGLSLTLRAADGLIETRRYDAAGTLVRIYRLLEE